MLRNFRVMVAFAFFLLAILGNHVVSSEESTQELEDTLGSYIYIPFGKSSPPYSLSLVTSLLTKSPSLYFQTQLRHLYPRSPPAVRFPPMRRRQASHRLLSSDGLPSDQRSHRVAGVQRVVNPRQRSNFFPPFSLLDSAKSTQQPIKCSLHRIQRTRLFAFSYSIIDSRRFM